MLSAHLTPFLLAPHDSTAFDVSITELMSVLLEPASTMTASADEDLSSSFSSSPLSYLSSFEYRQYVADTVNQAILNVERARNQTATNGHSHQSNGSALVSDNNTTAQQPLSHPSSVPSTLRQIRDSQQRTLYATAPHYGTPTSTHIPIASIATASRLSATNGSDDEEYITYDFVNSSESGVDWLVDQLSSLQHKYEHRYDEAAAALAKTQRTSAETRMQSTSSRHRSDVTMERE